MSHQQNSNSPSSDLITLKDQIHEEITKAKSVLTCAMFATEFVRKDMELDNHTLYHALWAADDYLEELEILWQRFENLN